MKYEVKFTGRFKKDLKLARKLGIGHQNFDQLITSNNFYVDKTMFIR